MTLGRQELKAHIALLTLEELARFYFEQRFLTRK